MVTFMRKYKETPDHETAFDRGHYKEGEIEELYQFEPARQGRPEREERPLPEPKIIREVAIRHRTTPRLEDHVIQPLKLMGEEVVGSLFDRVAFLKTRIEETTQAMALREAMHKEMLAEIDVDIREKEGFIGKATDLDEKRNIKLDISVLRKEKRQERVQFWRDLTELRSELRELVEKYETESKIVQIFREISPDGEEQP